MDAIFNRRSVRRYQEKKISEEAVTTLLKAAMRAPSAKNQQPWEFVVLRDKTTMEKITEFHHFSNMLKEADCAIVVCANLKRRISPFDFWIQDCAAATENILLEAQFLGIGAVWLGIYPDESRYLPLKALLNLPEDVIPVSVVSLGYPLKEPRPLDTFEPERIHMEKWTEETK